MSKNVGSLLENIEQSTTNSSDIGEFGETAAIGFLKRLGFEIIVANFKAPIGRNRKGVQVSGEIDIIAFDHGILCFVEVKTRSSKDFLAPESAVDLRKQRQIIRTARAYRKIFGIKNLRHRYDVVSVVLKGKKAPEVRLLKGYWSEKKFKKKLWAGEGWRDF